MKLEHVAAEGAGVRAAAARALARFAILLVRGAALAVLALPPLAALVYLVRSLAR